MLSLIGIKEFNPLMYFYTITGWACDNCDILGIFIRIKPICKSFNFRRLDKRNHLIKDVRNNVCNSLSFCKVHFSRRGVNYKREFKF